MLKNILIISSNHTGHGHKSITEALSEKFAKYNDINVHVIDGFTLGGNALLMIGKSYGPITRRFEGLWKQVWEISSKKPQLINDFIESLIEHNLLLLLEQIKPDLILSVHPNFNGSILNILEKHQVRIPFITLIADLVNISPLWADSRADYIISPTHEAKSKCMEFDVPESKIKIFGFPVRSRFWEHHVGETSEVGYYQTDRPLQCLIMSGGEGAGNMSKIADILLDNFNCTVKIVAGRNKKAKTKLEKTLIGRYGNKVEVYGFVDNIQDLMVSSDIIFTRGSPNVMMEAVTCNIPLAITGALPGQEADNPKYAEKHSLGVVCHNLNSIQSTVGNLLSNNAQKLNQTKKSQRDYRDPDAVNNIVEFIIDAVKDDYLISRKCTW